MQQQKQPRQPVVLSRTWVRRKSQFAEVSRAWSGTQDFADESCPSPSWEKGWKITNTCSPDCWESWCQNWRWRRTAWWGWPWRSKRHTAQIQVWTVNIGVWDQHGWLRPRAEFCGSCLGNSGLRSSRFMPASWDVQEMGVAVRATTDMPFTNASGHPVRVHGACNPRMLQSFCSLWPSWWRKVQAWTSLQKEPVWAVMAIESRGECIRSHLTLQLWKWKAGWVFQGTVLGKSLSGSRTIGWGRRWWAEWFVRCHAIPSEKEKEHFDSHFPCRAWCEHWERPKQWDMWK